MKVLIFIRNIAFSSKMMERNRKMSTFPIKVKDFWGLTDKKNLRLTIWCVSRRFVYVNRWLLISYSDYFCSLFGWGLRSRLWWLSPLLPSGFGSSTL